MLVLLGGTAQNQSLGAEHSQPFHAYIMGIPGLKICTAARAEAAYGLAKSMIRDNGPGKRLTDNRFFNDLLRDIAKYITHTIRCLQAYCYFL